MRYLIFLLLLAGCFAQGSLMTLDSYENVQIGEPISQITTSVGEPYAIHAKGGDKEEYEYIERINIGNQLLSENHYFIIVNNGRVVGKYVTRKTGPAYNLIYQEDPNYNQYPYIYP